MDSIDLGLSLYYSNFDNLSQIVLNWDSNSDIMYCLTDIHSTDPCITSLIIEDMELCQHVDIESHVPSGVDVFSNEYLNGSRHVNIDDVTNNHIIRVNLHEPAQNGWSLYDCDITVIR